MGTGSAVRYHLLADAHAMVIGLDMMDYRTVVALIRAQLPRSRVEDCMRRFRFVRMDMAKLTFQSMDKQCRQHFGEGVLALHHAHFSWMCRTTSKADRGFSNHRWADGRARSRQALLDDQCLSLEHRVGYWANRPGQDP